MTLQELTQTALSLPLDMRIALMDELNHSLHHAESAIEQAWIDEANTRMQGVESGKVTLIDGQQVFEQLLKPYTS